MDLRLILDAGEWETARIKTEIYDNYNYVGHITAESKW